MTDWTPRAQNDQLDPLPAAAAAEPSTVFGHEGQPDWLVRLQHQELDRSRRREWVAALRHGADGLADCEDEDFGLAPTPYLRELADLIERGDRTPWADTPEPVAAPAEQAQEGPGGDDAPTGTPEGSGAILGRALLYGRAVLRQQWNDGEDWWGSPFVRALPRAEAEQLYGATEVLLVSPAAGKVLEAVGAIAEQWHRLPGGPMSRTGKALLAAWDALVSDGTTGSGDGGRAAYEAELARLRAGDLEPAGDGSCCGIPACGGGCGVRAPLPDAIPVPLLPSQTPRPVLHWLATSVVGYRVAGITYRPVDVDIMVHPSSVAADLTRPGGAEIAHNDGEDRASAARRQLIANAIRDRGQEVAEPSPEPDSGTGWNRAWLLDCMLPHLPGSSYNEPDLHDEAQRQVTALLGDLDQQVAELKRIRAAWWKMQAFRDQNADGMIALTEKLRAELAEVTADRNRLREHGVLKGQALDAALADVQRLRAEVDTAWTAAGDMAAIEERAAADRAEVERLRGEVEKLNGWLNHSKADRKYLRDELATAHRDGAADALAWLAEDALCADDRRQAVRDVAAALRAEEWTIPASNEEATPDGA